MRDTVLHSRWLTLGWALVGLSALPACSATDDPASASEILGATGGSAGVDASGGRPEAGTAGGAGLGAAAGSAGAAGAAGAAPTVEQDALCTNGVDDDGDGRVDCADVGCKPACAKGTCAAPLELAANGSMDGSTFGREPAAVSCASELVDGTVVYRVKAAQTGVLDVTAVDPQGRARVTLAASCGGAELACSSGRASRPVAAGDVLFVAVSGSGGPAAYGLVVENRTPRCGDGLRDTDEQCDDGNTALGDGCEACVEVLTEESGNDSTGTATVLTASRPGRLESSTDRNVYRLDISGTQQLDVAVRGLSTDECRTGVADTTLRLLAADGSERALRTEGAGGACPRLFARLDTGTWYVEVSAGPRLTGALGYALELKLTP